MAIRFFRIIAWIAILFCAKQSMAFTPQAGVWAINDELNGKPGRGFEIDVQGATAFIAVYAYGQDGKSIFYTAIGSIINNTITAPLNYYSGGRYFGGPDQSASVVGSPGNIIISFSNGTTATVTFPGEQPKAASRFIFGVQPDPDGLFGEWAFISKIGSSNFVDRPTLNKKIAGTNSGNGVVLSPDAKFACEHNTTGVYSGQVLCIQLGSTNTLTDSYLFSYSVNDGEGYWISPTSFNRYPLRVFRLTTGDIISTGITKTAEKPSPPSLPSQDKLLAEPIKSGAQDVVSAEIIEKINMLKAILDAAHH